MDMTGYTSNLKDQLSVIISEENENSLKSSSRSVDPEAAPGTDTLKKGKDSSNSRTKNRKEKRNIEAKRKTDKKGDAGGCCASGGCTIF